jgi:uncharacterized OB-fold protein
VPSRVVLVESMKPIRLTILKCKRCGTEWVPRKEAWPKRCPNQECRSVYWDTDRKAAS